MITRSVLFSLKCTRNHLVAGLRPDPLALGELERSPRKLPPDTLAVLEGLGPPGRKGKGDIVALHTTPLRIDC